MRARPLAALLTLLVLGCSGTFGGADVGRDECPGGDECVGRDQCLPGDDSHECEEGTRSPD
jgi:hypothetical protein